jgi:ankyrin repeat protein
MRLFAAVFLVLLSVAAHPAAAIDLLQTNPFFYHVTSGDLEKVERSLATGSNVNATDPSGRSRTALIMATVAGNDEMVRLLLRFKAKPDMRDDGGNAALSYAAAGGHVEMAVALIKAGATVDIENRQGLTPLMFAASEGESEVARELLVHKADFARRDYTGRTALMWAERNGKAAVSSLLRRSGAKE